MMSLLKQILHRLKAQKGETLAETLAAILISALAISALSTGIATATRFNSDAHNHEAAIRTSMQAAERAAEGDALSGGTAQVTVTSDEGSSHNYEVIVYGVSGGEDGTSEVVSYSRSTGV